MVNLPSKFSEINVELGIPYIGKISGIWKPDADEQFAAWELYVELVTRVPVAELQDQEGSLREALTSLYTIFTMTRDILHKYGPAIARPKEGGAVSFGFLAISILNHAIRPILAYWHPVLLAYEHAHAPGISILEHERQWERAGELRHALQQTRSVLVNYAELLAQVAGVPPMHLWLSSPKGLSQEVQWEIPGDAVFLNYYGETIGERGVRKIVGQVMEQTSL